MSMAVRTKPKRKLARKGQPAAVRARPAAVPERRAPAPIVVTVQRRKLVNWRTGEVHCDPAGNVATWDSTDPAAEVALLAKAASGGGWALVPEGYRFEAKGPEGMLWR
ncbi:MAG: hypothetical protein DCC68_25895 [Planctomycetota bacterium]|nr:MAG: hypothetical protein DCC68_25895 [Planctomycetota bacterium]